MSRYIIFRINANKDLFVHITLLFSALLVHGSVPRDFLLSTVIPIPKGCTAISSDSANCRGITLSSVFCKLFDLLILSRFRDK